MEHLTFKEHLVLTEARRPGWTYLEKKVKGLLDRLTVTLSGTEAANMTKIAKRYARLEASMAAMKVKRDELNARLKDEIGDMFDAEDVVLTRVVETAQFTLTLAKEIKKADTTEVDYASIIAALSALIDEELQPKVEKIIEKYTKTVPAKEPVKTLKVSKEVIKEGLLTGIKGWLKSFASWATSYDKKLAKLKKQAGLA